MSKTGDSAGDASDTFNPEFSVIIVVCDHYLSRPIPGIDVIYSDFRGSDIKQVPVLRIFGPTPEGRKACLHIHGVFPYFYIPCPSPNPEPQYLYKIAASLDKALNIALKQANSVNQHVYKISLVKGLPFYGFHDKEHLYLKVFLYSPGLIKQAVELCSNGAILGQQFQPHESHLNFTLQFFIDFNLFGMSNIDLQTVKFRKSGVIQNSNDPLESTDEELKSESSCFYEADCVASHIINRQRIGKGDGIENPGLEEVWNQEMERRRQLNMSIASKSLSQQRFAGEETESHYKFEQMFLIKMSNLVDQPVVTDENMPKALETVYYPAESLEESQLFNAVDVSVHLPNTTLGVSMDESVKRGLDESLVNDIDNTIVDESLALNCSLHYSQVLLNSEDLDFLDILQGMDEKPIEDDSIMGTPVNEERDGLNLDDDDYSQAYNNETICLNPGESKDDTHTDDDDGGSSTWNDSYWDGANITQLDGTFDDEHVKKVRKRKMRPFKLGLTKPKAKKKEAVKPEVSTYNPMDTSEVDEINVSRETIEDISDMHLRRAVKVEPKTVAEHSMGHSSKYHEVKDAIESSSIFDLVDKIESNTESSQKEAAKIYDIRNNFVPEAGPSKIHSDNATLQLNYSNNNSNSSQEDDNTGIMSFYTSKVFDLSLEGDATNTVNKPVEQLEIRVQIENVDQNKLIEDEELTPHKLKGIDSSLKIITPKIKPPTKSYIAMSLEQYNIPKIVYPEPFYSDHKDVGTKVEIGQLVLKLNSRLARDQKPFEKVTDTSLEEWRHLLFMQTNEMCQESTKPDNLRTLLAGNKTCVLEPVKRPPTSKEVKRWIDENAKNTITESKIDDISQNIEELDNSQALGLNEDILDNSISLECNAKEKASLDNTLQVTMQPNGSFLCFGSNPVQHETSSIEAPTVDVNFLTLMLLEVHTAVRGELHPDPSLDAIEAIFLTVTNDSPPNHFLPKHLTEILVVDDMSPPKYLDRCIFKNVTYVSNESQIIEKVIDLVKKHDPDIMCGYEIEMNSWGYLLERAQILDFEIVMEISRITEKYRQKRLRGGNDKDFEGRIIGRVMFNVWRLFRHELALSSYSFENCMFEVLKERVPKYSYAQLANWWGDESRILRWITCEYYLTRLSGTVRMLEKLDIINRTSELARLFGLQWWEVLSRGSQFRVESLMLRAARPLNLIAMSPTVKQRAAMRAPECLPLIFEPESRYYTDPMIILDFQSLYPSMMIAYNYCFSTCIGRVQNISGDSAYEFGAWRLRISKSKLETLVKKGLVHWSPVGVGFVKPSVRRGVLPALLRRILAARQAVKKSMKLQTDEAVKKAMHSRQLGLKLIANVTYGYTAANFSGRMPCVEVGDSVVAKGRETLERAIKLVRSNPKWNVKVVYGDTDSMFVLVPGATRTEAFQIGQEIADAVTADNPSPVALKLEKVYQPCILQTKKRYVGYMYESAEQEKPIYEAKGIETVRRDGCPAGVKLLKQALCELFQTGDMSRVKRTVCAELSRLARGTLPVQDLLFTREYHGPAAYRAQANAPPNEIALRRVSRDPRSGPRTGERVAWLVTAGAPGLALYRLAREPAELARDPSLTPHVAYYAGRVLLPPLHRCLSLRGAVVLEWWNELGYTREKQQREVARGGIARYMARERCVSCGAKGVRGTALCSICSEGNTDRAAVTIASRGNVARTYVNNCENICSCCCGHRYSSACENIECPVFFRRITARQRLAQMHEVMAALPRQFTREPFEL